MKLTLTTAVTFAAACAALASSCKTHAPDPAPAPSASPPAASAGAAATSPPPAAKPWFSGAYQGTYEAKLAPVEIKVGAVKEWAADDGKASSGPGKLALKIGNDGMVDGAGEGALGASHATGKVEDDTLRVVLAPDDMTGLRGVLVATKDGDGFRGSIEASSGDSLRVRQAAIELKKQPN